MSSVTFSTTVGGDGSTVTDDDNATTGLGNGGALIRLVPMMQQVVNVASHVVSVAGGAGDDAAAAAASAVAAATSATAATTNGAAQVTLAAAQVSLATAQANAAAASYDSFDDRYLGSKTSDPSVDNDGNTLLVGALYWNSSSSVMKVWTGSTWTNPNPATGYLALSGGTMTGAITFAAGQTISATSLKSATTDIAISSATAPTTGQVLTATSSTAATWESASSGALVLLSTVSASGASTVNIETTFDSTYDNYVIIASDVSISANQLYCLLKISGSYQTANYTFVMNYTDASQAVNTSLSRTSTSQGTTNKIQMTNGTNNPMNFSMSIYKPTSSVQKQVSWIGTYGSVNAGQILGVGLNTGTGELTGVQFNSNGGTVTGTFRLYGISN